MKKCTLIGILLFFITICGKTQVTIGSFKDPNRAAVLDLDVTDKGLKFPNVILNMANLSDFVLSGSDSEDVKKDAVGIIVYNVVAGNEGLYVWDGTKWNKIGDTSKIEDTEKKLQTELNSLTKNLTSSGLESLRLPIPTILARVELSGSIDWDKLSKDDALEVKIAYNDFQGNYFEKKALMTYQGASSMTYPKKNFSIDLLNDNKKSCNLRFGNWVTTDSYNLKANYIDFTQARNISISRLAHQAVETYPLGKQFPWEKIYDPNNKNLTERFSSGAKGVIDGFPIELYINGEYWGLYTFNLKKTRKNFDMKKNEATKIIMGAETDNSFIEYIPEQWEFKNPDPVTSETTNAINRVFSWMNKVKRNNSMFLSEYEQYWSKNEWIDYYIFLQLFYLTDCVYKNMLLCTSDGLIWYPKLYDLDTSFGLDWMGSQIIPGSETLWIGVNSFPMPWYVVIYCWESDIIDRYKELRKTVLSNKNVENTVRSIIDVIGIENYEKDAKRWLQIPSNGNPDVYGYHNGCYAGLNQMMDWYTKRAAWLDEQWAN